LNQTKNQSLLSTPAFTPKLALAGRSLWVISQRPAKFRTPTAPQIQKTDLVDGFNPSEKYEFVSWDDEIPN
jgi:hypothetical protein